MGWMRKLLLALGFVGVIVGACGAWIVYSAENGFRGNVTAHEVREQADAGGLERIIIRSDFSDVRFVRSDDARIHFMLSGAMDEQLVEHAGIVVKQTDRTLRADVRLLAGDGKLFHFDIFELLHRFNGSLSGLSLEIALPDRMFGEIELRSDVGSLEASQPILAERLRLRTSFGNIQLRSFRGAELDVQTDTGEIIIESAEATRLVEAETSFGNIRVGLPIMPERSEFDSDTGNITITVPRDAPMRVDLSTDLGKVRANLPHLELRTETERAIESAGGSGQPVLRAETDFGDVTVEMR